jgi:hypothetical protein
VPDEFAATLAREWRPNEIETASGRLMDLNEPWRSTMVLDDIAHGMANTCRYSGHVRAGLYPSGLDDMNGVTTWWGTQVPIEQGGTAIPIHYSIAEHAVYVSLLLQDWGEPWEIVFAGLHHDDPESYLSDIARPGKSLLQPQYGLLEDKMDAAVAKALKAPWLFEAMHSRPVKNADNWMLLCEGSELMPSRGVNWFAAAKEWNLDVALRGVDDPLPEWWQGEKGRKREVLPDEAKRMYLARHWELMNR